MGETTYPEEQYELLSDSEAEHNHERDDELEPLPSMGSDSIAKAEGRRGDDLAKRMAMIGISILTICTWGITLNNNPTSLGLFPFHPLLQSLALVCFTYGILTLQPTSQPATKAAGLKRHQLAMLGVGLPCIILGTSAIILRKWYRAADHFTTWHGTFGIAAVLWMVVQALFGGASVWYGGAILGGGAKAKALWKYHRISGYVLFPLLLVTAHLGGAWSHWAASESSYAVRLIAYYIAPVVTLVGIYLRLRPSKMAIR
ncbi:hypothetical protein BJ138DRAFT_1153519 [Hygrophoropsis aurantiaca]|uniref:Uncharacterized protein n=1 Tax=Hygrophoropsis aurantiaca TaxID=72124 RepID=A0ACB8AAU1_9AGAM|nr:hypothetical protein BJ138DRAFT_1153519 [Hygrophoropsis aurantiaca]